MSQNAPRDGWVQPGRSPIAILGIPFDHVTMEDTVRIVAEMVASGRPHYIATANVDFTVQASEDVELRRILFDAHLVVCDGMPLLWASRLLGNPLPARVTGADLVPRLLIEAEQRGWRVFFLGGSEDSVARAAARSLEKHPRLRLVGAYSPPYRPLLEMDHADLIRRINASRADLLFVAFGCPKQEKWINMHYRDCCASMSVGVGATIDFLGGTMRRAPVWMQRLGLEWLFRMLQEPGRLAARYGRGSLRFGRAIRRQMRELKSRPARPPGDPTPAPRVEPVRRAAAGPGVVVSPPRLDAAEVSAVRDAWDRALATGPLVLDLRTTSFVDSTGVGLLVRLRKRGRELDHDLMLAGPTPAVLKALDLMKLRDFFEVFDSPEAATAAHRGRRESPGARHGVNASAEDPEEYCWEGELTAASVPAMTEAVERRMAGLPPDSQVRIDLRGVPFADSSGLGLMVAVKKRAWQRGIRVRYINPTPNVASLLRLSRLDAFLIESSP